jgi:ABC-2 type transport system ATP-binding protein
MTAVSAGYGATVVLRDVDLALGPGLHVVIGPNGSGKTTLFRTMCGVLPPLVGTVAQSGGIVGYVMHRAAFSARLSARDNLRYWSMVYGQRGAGRVEAALTYVGGDGFADTLVSKLSRGQAQRLTVARALLADPALLLLDDPLSGVDPSGVAELLGLFGRLAAEGRCVVVSSHSLAELSQVPGDVVALRGGRIVSQGRARDLLSRASGGRTRLRLRGGPDLAAAVAAAGWTAEPLGDDVVEVVSGSDAATADLVKALADRGVNLIEVAPVVDELTQLYRLLEGGDEA